MHVNPNWNTFYLMKHRESFTKTGECKIWLSCTIAFSSFRKSIPLFLFFVSQWNWFQQSPWNHSLSTYMHSSDGCKAPSKVSFLLWIAMEHACAVYNGINTSCLHRESVWPGDDVRELIGIVFSCYRKKWLSENLHGRIIRSYFNVNCRFKNTEIDFSNYITMLKLMR